MTLPLWILALLVAGVGIYFTFITRLRAGASSSARVAHSGGRRRRDRRHLCSRG